VVAVPDPRLDQIQAVIHSKQIIPAAVEILDIAGLVRGASKGEGLGNQFLGHIRSVDAVLHVVRCFADPDVVHVDGKVDPRSDIEVIETELILADMQTLEKAVPRLEKEARNNKERKAVHEAAVAAQALLNDGTTLFAAGTKVDSALLRELNLLTTKPFLYVFNADESVLGDEAKMVELRALVAPADAVFLDAKVESELIDLDPADARELLSSMGQTESGLDQLARIGFDTLGLQTYLTAGPKEARAWTIGKGWKAPQAAGVIHTDFEKGFIKAEIVSYDDLTRLGSVAAARDAGKYRLEGKEYVFADGDVALFRFNN
jgi:GTP-binding protein YchF